MTSDLGTEQAVTPEKPDDDPPGGRAETATTTPARRADTVASSCRWTWRQLTSMRTALVLLLLLALGAIPGSVIPQRGVDALKTAQLAGRRTRT